jgi:beta-N-acetylhexosaminidase
MENIILVFRLLYKNSIFIFFRYLLIVYSFPIFAQDFSVDTMSLEEKVGQLLIVHFYGKDANANSNFLIQKLYVGGIIYYEWANGLESYDQIKHLSLSLQKQAQQNSHPIPLWLCVDQEGGKVTRLKQGFTQFISNKILAEKYDLQLTYKNANQMALELKSVGINWNFAPVVDLANPGSYMEDRCYGADPNQVIQHAQVFIQAFENQNVLCCLKHFPGHGSVKTDSHQDLPVQLKTENELFNSDLIPFVHLSNIAPAIMTAHIQVPGLDPKNCSTLSPIILETLLRKKIGFEGIIISDSLAMEGVLKNASSIEEVAIQAFNAGCDILLLGGKQLNGEKQNFEINIQDIEKIHHALVHAVRSGRLSEEKINYSVDRILRWKQKILSNQPF